MSILMTSSREHCDDKCIENCDDKACNTVKRSIMEHSDAENVENCDDRGMLHWSDKFHGLL